MKTLLFKIIFVCVFCVFTKTGAQNEVSKWLFAGGGLDFMSNPPAGTGTCALTLPGGSSSISDASGNLLFYSDGATIFNSQHLPMANGSGLLNYQPPGPGTTVYMQPVLIVKKPGSNSIYYVFTQSGWLNTPTGLRYSTVDMTLAAGLGSVVAKDDTLYAQSQTQKLAGTAHCNGTDTWILTKDMNQQFRAYRITPAGVDTTAVISMPIPGPATGSTATTGQLKISPNGRKIGYCNSYVFNVFDFDNATGIVSNNLTIAPGWLALGCEFSPDGTKFYGCSAINPEVSQWNLAAGSNSAVFNSKYTYPVSTGLNHSSMQLAGNGKIYLSGMGSFLGVIDNTNLPGQQSTFTAFSQSVFPSASSETPNFVSSYFKKPLLPLTYTVNPLISCATASFFLPN